MHSQQFCAYATAACGQADHQPCRTAWHRQQALQQRLEGVPETMACVCQALKDMDQETLKEVLGNSELPSWVQVSPCSCTRLLVWESIQRSHLQ